MTLALAQHGKSAPVRKKAMRKLVSKVEKGHRDDIFDGGVDDVDDDPDYVLPAALGSYLDAPSPPPPAQQHRSNGRSQKHSGGNFATPKVFFSIFPLSVTHCCFSLSSSLHQ